MSGSIAADAPPIRSTSRRSGFPLPTRPSAAARCFVGEWTLEGRTADSAEPDVHGTASARQWCPSTRLVSAVSQ